MVAASILRASRALLAASALLGAEAPAVAEEPPPPTVLQVLGEGAAPRCPSPEAIAAELAPLLPGTRIVTEPLQGAVSVRVADRGASYRVALSVPGVEPRELLDVDRRCDERARAAAVFIALALEPPAVPAPAPAPAAPPAAAPPVAAAPPLAVAPLDAAAAARPSLRADLELAALLDGAPGQGLLAGGASARLALGSRHLLGALGASVLSPAGVPLPVAGASASLLRAPFDADVRAMLARGRFEALADLGLSVTLLSVAGQGLAAPRSGARVDLGLRVALAVRFRLARRVALQAAVEARVVPQPHQLAVDNATVATLPYVWLGGALGLAFRLNGGRD